MTEWQRNYLIKCRMGEERLEDLDYGAWKIQESIQELKILRDVNRGPGRERETGRD